MGLNLSVKGGGSFDIGYITFTHFRMELARKINTKLGELYKKWLFQGLNNCELKELNELSGDLAILLAHSDCDGTIQPHESRKLYKALENIELDCIVSGYCGQDTFNVLEKLKELLKYSWKNRRRIIFS